MTGVLLLFAIACLIAAFVFIQLSQSHINVKRQRTLLYDSILREHRYWHLCRGGLSVDENGAIAHFAPDEGADYDASRESRK